MKLTIELLLILLLILPVNAALAADPTFKLQGGGTVTVDPDTNRATITRDGITTPMWDGTHRMQDGSTLFINRGITVPNQAIIEPRDLPVQEAEEWEGAPIVGYSPCEKLVRRVCGKENQCGEVEGCNLARQLFNMEDDERSTSKFRSRMTHTSGQCLNMMQDTEIFPLCPQVDR